MNLNELTIAQARQKLDNKEITALELTQACLVKIKEVNQALNICLTICESEALASAVKADERLAQGETSSLLGIPYLAKDNILTKNIRTTAASKSLENYIAPYNATIINKLEQAGAILLGKTNLDEFAHGASTENSAFGVTKNPLNPEYVPGGSSGGSAAAIASHCCLFAIGTDTGGSIRHPASFCGVIGFKPTYGLASRFGLVAMTSSTDVPGPLTKTVLDSALVLEVISGVDQNDLTTVNLEIPKYSNNLPKNLTGFKIGVIKEFSNNNSLLPEVKQAFEASTEKLKKLGAEIIEISLPSVALGVAVYYIITPSEVSSNLARFDGITYGFNALSDNLTDHYLKSRGQSFGPETKRRIMLGTYALSSGYHDAYYLQAQKVRTKICEEFEQAFKQVDLMISPTTPATAFKIGEKSSDPLQMYLEDIFLTGPSLAGLPAVSVPCGLANNNLPMGLQIIGNKFAETKVIQVANIFTL